MSLFVKYVIKHVFNKAHNIRYIIKVNIVDVGLLKSHCRVIVNTKLLTKINATSNFVTEIEHRPPKMMSDGKAETKIKHYYNNNNI